MPQSRPVLHLGNSITAFRRRRQTVLTWLVSHIIMYFELGSQGIGRTSDRLSSGSSAGFPTVGGLVKSIKTGQK